MVTLVLIGVVGGLITGISPCILPVIPVVFLAGGAASQTRDRARPYLIVAGLALSFSAFTLLGTLLLSALPLPKDTIRWAGLAALVLLGVAMMFPRVQQVLERPFARIPQRQVGGQRGAFVLGLALGAVYVPCAGPVLAAITVAGATGKIGGQTVALTVAFAVGTAMPLLAFALAGQRVTARVRAFRERQRTVQVTAGLVVIALAVALTFNVTDALQRAVPDYTASLNNALDHNAHIASRLGKKNSDALQMCAFEPVDRLASCGGAPELAGITAWLNTPGGAPLSLQQLAGRVVLIDFWAYSCINCQRAIPHVESWYSAYHADGLDVIGVHTPEYAFEHVVSNVAAGAQRLHVTYPVAIDNGYTTWNRFDNESWPAEYLIDSTGEIRHVGIGEGDYGGTEQLIRQLLKAANPAVTLPPPTDLPDRTPTNADQTPETYLGVERAQGYAGDGKLRVGTWTYNYPATLKADRFALTGTWTVTPESITAGVGAGIELDYDASDVYLDVGGAGTITAAEDGVMTSYHVAGAPNIYTVAHHDAPGRHTLTVDIDPGLSAYSFTFG